MSVISPIDQASVFVCKSVTQETDIFLKKRLKFNTFISSGLGKDTLACSC